LREIKDKKKLTLLRETIKTDNNINIKIARSISQKKFKSVAVLGLSYKGNLKVDVLSPTIPFVNYLKKKKIKVKLFDPYYNEQEIKKTTNLKMIKFPNELKNFECIVVCVDHKYFIDNFKIIRKNLKNCKYILDNMGIWKNFKFSKKITYKISGEENWI
jgi:UDP-N-acetyl-D-mannosaminuronate dehydrogenase